VPRVWHLSDHGINHGQIRGDRHAVIEKPRGYPVALRTDRSAESKGVGRHAGIQETDLESVVGNFAFLPDQVVETLTAHDARTFCIDIRSVTVAGRLAVNGHLEPDRIARNGAEYEVQIPYMKPIDDAAVFAMEHGAFLADRPVARQTQLI